MIDYAAVDRAIEGQLDSTLEELKQLCAQPSIAAQNEGMQACAELVAKMLAARQFDVDIMQTGGHPVVYAERAGRSDRTLIFYNHYDVQPPEPIELWETPPFEPTLRDGKLFGRGVTDDKGHFQCRLAALDALLEVEGELPCNVKFLVEGEEEIGSVHLPAFVEANAELLAADACVWEFGALNEAGQPVQYAGMRGICYVELSTQTADIDAHSGLGGSIFPNAAWRLVWALSSLKGPDEKVMIPGFYDRVRPPSARDMSLLEQLPDVADTYRRRYGVTSFLRGLEGGAELLRAEVFEPTCTICGLNSGYQGPGTKTVLPARASAKVDFRLVPDQEPEEVLELLRIHLDANGFDDVQVSYLGGEPPGRTDPEDAFLQLVVQTAEEVYGEPMLLQPMIGGSGPNHAFLHHLKVPVATAGIGYPGSQAHAPNENMVIRHFVDGARHTARILGAFSAD